MASQVPTRSTKQQADDIIATLKRRGTKAVRDGMARYAIPSDKAFGVPVGAMKQLAKGLGRNHDVALALWGSGWYEARMIAAFLGEPDRLTPAMMDRWCRDFDNWAVCDHVCFHLFDRTPHAWGRVKVWSTRRDEFGRRAAFALLASLALHDKAAHDDAFLRCLPLVERAAADDRNFVKKGVSWALRLIGRRNRVLHAAAVAVAARLLAAEEPSSRWIGKDAHRELTSTAVMTRLKARKI